ncbi:MAG: prepilin-type N-terminal cleavage/methylation domain-containing protein [Clostridiales bacterium]|jgi:prepilin-type N-terminal cleavage/methylation domain-containing protein|nr:prepilin-type N-terminal cleavage/methylation domain-containing protein [Clostridiales bacterium]
MRNVFKRDERGLTLMELIIVLAVIAIIGAILAPNFLSATDRARLKSDIQSAKVIQTAIETYNAEHSTPIPEAADVATILGTLTSNGYLSASSSLSPQTDDAIWSYVPKVEKGPLVVKLDISSWKSTNKGDLYNALSEDEKAIVVDVVVT